MGSSEKYSITTVPEMHDLSDLAAQCVMQPGMSRVFLEILSQKDGAEFYVREERRVVGLTFGQARKMYVKSTLCGLVNRISGLSTSSSAHFCTQHVAVDEVCFIFLLLQALLLTCCHSIPSYFFPYTATLPPSGHSQLNPADSVVISPEDSVLVLATDRSQADQIQELYQVWNPFHGINRTLPSHWNACTRVIDD